VTDASSDPTPWRLAAAGWGAYSTSGHAGTPRGCRGAVTHAGLILREHPVQAWLAFSCSMHTDDLIAARPLLDRDRAVLADWRARERRTLDGQGWDPPRPLAVGTAANYLVRRALRKTATWPLG
jgi:hypothetical protein